MMLLRLVLLQVINLDAASGEVRLDAGVGTPATTCTLGKESKKGEDAGTARGKGI